MKRRNWIQLGGLTMGALGLGLALKNFLPQRWDTQPWSQADEPQPSLDTSSYPEIEVSFLRCGSTTIPEMIAVRGGSPFRSCVIAHSAVLIRHPRATFLYDTGLSADIYTYLVDQPLLFRKTLASFKLEQSLSNHLSQLGMGRKDLDFALLSHLHWDHVSGLPDIRNVRLRIHRVEYEAAKLGLLDANRGLVRQLLGDNPFELFDCSGPTYEGFRSSYDLLGDGSIVLVPLPGHTAGNTGMFINRFNGSRLFLLGDAVWVSANYRRPATMHPLVWSPVTSDDATARQTIVQLHHFARRRPEIPLIAMHDAELQEAFMAKEQVSIVQKATHQ